MQTFFCKKQELIFMQSKAGSVERDLMKEMEVLITSIKKTGKYKRDEDLALALHYNDGFFSQTRSRKNASIKLINRLSDHLAGLQNATMSNTLAEEAVTEVQSAEIRGSDIPDLLRNNKVLSDANKTLAEANLILARSHDQLVQLAKQALSINLEKLTQAAESESHQDEAGNHFQKVLKRNPGSGQGKETGKKEKQDK